MKNLVKIAIAAAAAAAGTAQAANITHLPNNTGFTGSDVVLFLADQTTGAAFLEVDFTSILLDANFVGHTQVASDPAFNNTTTLGSFTTPSSLNSGPIASVVSFLSAHTGDTIDYSFMAAEGIAPSQAAGGALFLATFDPGTNPAAAGPTSSIALGMTNGTQTFFKNYNNAGVANPNATYGWGKGTGGSTAPTSFQGVAAYQNGDPVGTAMYFYEIAAYGSGALANVYKSLNTITLNADGSITVGQAPAVPIPGAIWLLGSGLLGLASIGRRREPRLTATSAA